MNNEMGKKRTQAAVRLKACGECNLCCVLFTIDELNKPHDVVCPHSTKEGCTIYADRPALCKTFVCQWLDTKEMGEELRPDKCGIIYHRAGGMLLATQRGIYSHMNRANVLWMKTIRQRDIPFIRQYVNEDGTWERAVEAKSRKEAELISKFVDEGILRAKDQLK